MVSWTEHYCHSCARWNWDSNLILNNSKVIFRGHCGLYSSICNTTIFNHDKTPPRYLSMEGEYEEPDDQAQEAEEERVNRQESSL